jgi:outer membrane protein OmpA-like peptidoglycan-associated protein
MANGWKPGRRAAAGCVASAAQVLALVLTLGPASAAGPSGCPPLGELPGYAADEAVHRVYDTHEFTVAKPGSDDTEPVTVAGRFCIVDYNIGDGHDPMSDLEIQSNYRDQIDKLGGEVLWKDDRDTVARISKDGQETWLSVYSQETSIQLAVVEKAAPKFTLTAPGPGDYRLLGHMPGYSGDRPQTRNFDQMEFTVADGDDSHSVNVQGKTIVIDYSASSDATVASDAEIQFNYRQALEKLGAEIVFADSRNTAARLTSGGQTIWIKVYSQETSIQLSAVEEKPFQASIKPPAASALKAALDKTGRVALYVNFDFGKATLRPDAAPVVAQVTALLKADPALKLSVEGNTDNVGSAAANQTLSENRAGAVVAAVEAQGIGADRLASAGFGATKPIATNDTSEGRAKNRRVELVKR